MIILRKYFADAAKKAKSEEDKKDTKEKVPLKEKIRKVGHNAVNYAIDNPIDTAAWAVGDLVIPGKLAAAAKKKWKGKAGKAAAGALYAYALSPFGATTAAIAYKNKLKKRREEEKKNKTKNDSTKK